MTIMKESQTSWVSSVEYLAEQNKSDVFITSINGTISGRLILFPQVDLDCQSKYKNKSQWKLSHAK